ncbi:hypothetical protein [Streptantibioticus ferralitis]|uniref:hypothetical protein n=1 Tax=Streptantibioticus ferralitis TaxID=236510 RepID=UPI0027E24B53|nr:hypothetical protein [Streptantibioticus ferralitis]
MSTRDQGLRAASGTNSAVFALWEVWKRLSPRYAGTRTGRLSSARLTKYSSRGSRERGPWTAPARSRAVGGASPAAVNSRSRAAFRVE